MSYTANVYNVMLASPSDVNDERQAAREIILDWNNIHSPSRNIILLPSGWEHNAVPEMGDRPQGIINKQLVEKADLLVGIFWMRVGTPTGKAASGTVEEIEQHINSGKPAMLYFSDKPVVPHDIDPLQFEAVKSLKGEYQSKGLTESFGSLSDFQKKFQRHLTMKLNSDKYFENFVVEQSNDALPNTGQHSKLSSELSNEAKALLLEASSDANGRITRLDYSGGFKIATNGKQFVNDNDPRNKALWLSALEELENNDFISSSTYKREIFILTTRGYQMAERLK